MALKLSRLKTTVASLVALSAFLPAAGCDLANNHTKIDRSANNEFQDYRDALAPRENGFDSSFVASDVPDFQPYVAENVEKMPPMPLVSIAINQSIPLREALFELAKQADFDIELDPRIQGSVIFTARNKPMDVVIDRICEISGLRYKIDGTTLRIELDTPYSKNYKIDYLSFVRTNDSKMTTDVSVASSGGGESGGVSGGSSFSVTSKAESDFWTELDANIKQILTSNATGSYLKTSSDPDITLSTSTGVVPPVPPMDGASLQDVRPQAGTEYRISSPMSIPSAPEGQVSVPPALTAPEEVPVPSNDVLAPTAAPVAPQPAPVTLDGGSATAVAPVSAPPTLRIESLPSNLSGQSAGQNQVQFTPTFSINKQAGVISVFANERLHKQISEYLEEVKRSTTAQVLIEAKVLEVSLSDEFATGIDWSLLDRIGDFSVSGTFAKPSFTTASTNVITAGFSGNDISSFVSALSRFGTVHALASPRLTVLNNQSAVLNVAKNQVYFELDIQRDTTTDGTNSTVNTDINSDIKTVPEGVLINVLPSINLDKRVVSMQVRPTVTKIADYVNDPSVTFASGGTIESKIPIVRVQEVDSVLNMKSGEIMVMGGLLQDSTNSTQEGVPVASGFRCSADYSAIRATGLIKPSWWSL